MPAGNETHAQGPSTKDRVIRVFISSTFRDMQKERELLVKEVFPELRRVCDERFVSFTEVDLRWGITKEQQAEGKVLPICLEEIHTCRPYFIGIFGERYGWIPNTVPPEVLAKEPWIQEHIGQRTSVTELEILHGVLRNPKMAGHAFFYFRDPAYIAKLPANEQAEMVERDIPDDIKEFGAEEAVHRTQERRNKIAALKETIRKSHLRLVDSYATPKDLAAVIRQQFLDLIDALYPKEQVPDPLDQEAIGHRTYARRKLLACIDRPTHIAALDAFVDAPPDGRGLVVTGDSGGGKTALLAAWVTRYRKAHPEHFVLEHFFGATSESASVPRFLHRLLGELKRLANIPDEISSTTEKMAEALPLWLAQTIGKVPQVVLVLDALNQIEGEHSHRNLSWLPGFFPAHIRVIASSLSGPALETLRDRSWTEHPLPLADADERGRMVDAFLYEYRKELGPTLRNEIVNATGAANPLFLRTVLEELRQSGDFDHLPDKVRDYLQATTPVDLFRQVIRRWQADFQAGRDVVNRSLRCLWAARQGLSESEWLDLLADDQGPMDRQTWRPLLLALATHLVLRSGLWALGHDYLKQAIEIELLPTEDAKKHAHLALADYFEKHSSQQEMTPRKAAEWPHQLHAAQAWDRLETCLTDIHLFRALYNDNMKWELTGYWLPLRDRGRSMGLCYLDVYHEWIARPAHADDHNVPNKIGCFLLENGLYQEAEQPLRRALEVTERVLGPEHSDSLGSITNLAGLLSHKGDYVRAEPLARRVMEVRERVSGKDHPLTLSCINNLASILYYRGDLNKAEPLYRRALEAKERVLGVEHIDTSSTLNMLGTLLFEVLPGFSGVFLLEIFKSL